MRRARFAAIRSAFAGLLAVRSTLPEGGWHGYDPGLLGFSRIRIAGEPRTGFPAAAAKGIF